MAKYLIKACYSSDGLKGLLKEGGSNRVEAIREFVGSVGGSLESFHFAFGDTDAYLIVEVPDNATAAAVAATVSASGALKNYETVVLLTPAEMDEAGTKVVDYRPPGG